MNGQLELWHLVLLALSILGGYWALTKIIASQFQRSLDERFEAQAAALKAQADQLNQRLDVLDAASKQDVGQWQRVERELLNLKAELPLHYVRREDYVQAVATIMSKLDSMALRFENILLKGENRDNRR
jgi:bacterioferritin (cytochrome b1)